MSRRLVLLAVAVALGATLLTTPARASDARTVAQAAAPAAAGGSRYYLALGDSLAWGYQPVRPLDRAEGYVFQLHAALRRNDPSLELANIACPGETTRTLLTGGHCDYAGAGSQLDAAEAFLRKHRGHVSLVTIDIGGNDLNNCVRNSTVDPQCVLSALVTIAVNVAKTVTRLRLAAPLVRMAAMTYYDPYLAAYLLGPEGRPLAQRSLLVIKQLNAVLATVYSIAGFRVADVAGAFSTTDTTGVPLPGFGTVPLNVARICQWTWMCAPAPLGPDFHPNRPGYAVIAGAFRAGL
jgi:lysophospholipase L1-like esterase